MSTKYVIPSSILRKDQKEFIQDLKTVYKSASEEITFQNLGLVENKWGKKYLVVIQSWYNNWDHLSTFFKYPAEIRRIIYTTNTLEGFNRQLRKYTKTKSIYPTDEALKKSLYLATINIMKKMDYGGSKFGTSNGTVCIDIW